MSKKLDLISVTVYSRVNHDGHPLGLLRELALFVKRFASFPKNSSESSQES